MGEKKPDGIVSLQGRDYPTWPFVLNKAHEMGLRETHVELIQVPEKENEFVAIVKAIAVLSEGGTIKKFTAYGDASPKNVNSKIASALIRMAETRAKGRALRDATNIGQTMYEELPHDEPEPRKDEQQRTVPHKSYKTVAYDGLLCQAGGCNKVVPPETARRSKEINGEVWCLECEATVSRGADTVPSEAGDEVDGPPEPEAQIEPKLGDATCSHSACSKRLTQKEIDGCTKKGWPMLCVEHAALKKKLEVQDRLLKHPIG